MAGIFKHRDVIFTIGGVAGAVFASMSFMDWKRNQYMKQNCFQDALDILNENQAAVDKLGGPLTVGARLSLLTRMNQLDKYGGKCQLEIPIQGSNSKASLMVVARRKPMPKGCDPSEFPPWKIKLLYLGVKEEKRIYQIYGKVLDSNALQLDNPVAKKEVTDRFSPGLEDDDNEDAV